MFSTVRELFLRAAAELAKLGIEAPSAEAAASFTPPGWFGREVTEDARFSYSVLAKADGMEQVRKILEEST